MTDPLKEWNEIQRRRPPESPVSGFRHETPRILSPVCPEHCSGRHHREATLLCPQCHGVHYEVWAHEWIWSEAHYFYERKPMHGAPMDPSVPLICRDCGTELVRR